MVLVLTKSSRLTGYILRLLFWPVKSIPNTVARLLLVNNREVRYDLQVKHGNLTEILLVVAVE